jgi:hypothetical protein
VPTKKQLKEADRLLRAFDWAKYDAMSDEEVRAHWAWDKDMTWPTDKELKEFDLVLPPKARREMARKAARASPPPRSRTKRRAAGKATAKRRRKARVAAE